MPAPQTPYEAVLHAARDVAKLDCALDAEMLGTALLGSCYAYGDVYGDQTSYLVTFAYDDVAAGGPEHAVVALVDHNIGITKDMFVGTHADRILGQVKEMCAGD